MRVENRLFLVCFILAVLATLTSHSFQARGASVDLEALRGVYQRWERVMNVPRTERAQAIRFMHEIIADQAQFVVKVSNPAFKTADVENLKLTKSDYINSFVQGTNFVDNYHVAFQTLDMTEDGQGGAQAQILITERGIMKDPYALQRPGQAFESRTLCQTSHNKTEHGYVLTGGTCASTVALEESI
ncbi:MAG: hypothetical protein L6Q57_06010 [Alphaproteobacteria bacterium]|nr:hypothetical protein [Alphaproteobacteria bacterium]